MNHPDVGQQAPADTAPDLTRTVFRAFFFLSGATSLVFQVIWVRLLSLFFGSDVYSSAITLTVFMAGLAIGSWLMSLFADRVARPVLAYGVCEVAIALSALMVPTIIDGFQPIYHDVYVAHFDQQPWLYQALRIAVAAGTLLIPTTLMGATLPLLVRAFVRDFNTLGRDTGTLYAINTLGALVGTIMAAFVMLPMFGVAMTVKIVAAIGLIVGISSIAVGLWRGSLPVSPRALATDRSAVRGSMSTTRWMILVVMALSGMAALALEIVWMRILVQSFSATVYAFAIMLACFLFGLYYGSAKAANAVDRSPNPLLLLSYLQVGLGAAVALLAVLAYFAPLFFGALIWTLTGVSGGAFGIASVIAQFVVASILIIGPTLMLGAMFPCAIRAFTMSIEHRAAASGQIYAANTAGAITGALIGGFILLPTFGSRASLLVIASLFAINGLLLVFVQRVSAGWQEKPLYGVYAILVAGVLFGAIASFLPRQTTVNYGLQQSARPEVIYHGDGVSHTVDIVRNSANNTIMMINGNVEADTTFTQRRHFILKAHLPLLLHAQPKDVAVVGLGLGITLSAIARYPSVENIRLIELTPDMVKAHRHLTDLTGGILGNPKVHLRIDDGRNFMRMSNETFDMITADPVHPRITGVGYLYTRQYYEAIRSRLRPNGVVAQWMPMYNISRRSFDVAFRTFAEAFPNASFWYVRGHGLFVATARPTKIDCAALIDHFNTPAVKSDLASIEIASPEELLGHMLMDRGAIARYLASNRDDQDNTDDNAFLEYRTPFEFLGRTDAIMPDLIKYAGVDQDDTYMSNCAPQLRAAAGDAARRRLERILPELTEPIR